MIIIIYDCHPYHHHHQHHHHNHHCHDLDLGLFYPPHLILTMSINISIIFPTRNGVNVEGTDHKTVVDLIRQGKDTLGLVVISVTPSEARKLDGPSDAVGHLDHYDYTDRRSVPLTIPDCRTEEAHGQKYVVCGRLVFFMNYVSLESN